MEEENKKLKSPVADLSLDKRVLQDVLSGKSKARSSSVLVQKLEAAYEVSQRRACQSLGFPRTSHCYQSIGDERAELRLRLRALATSRPCFGYRRLLVQLQREGWSTGHMGLIETVEVDWNSTE